MLPRFQNPHGDPSVITARVPGDKSISHRALIFSSIAQGESRIRGGLVSEDIQATAAALRALGGEVGSLTAGEWRVGGVGLGGLAQRAAVLDCGNSGTSARLLLGLLAGLPGPATLSGDASLESRPMRRVTGPLTLMGARFDELGAPDRLPIRVHGGPLSPLDYDMPVASAQVKSALLMAGITGGAFVLMSEPHRSRDHTERMLAAGGISVLTHPGPTGWRVEMRQPPESLAAFDIEVPGDFSSAAFLIVAALLRDEGAPLRIAGVGLNPTRTGLLAVLERMGARVETQEAREVSGEPIGDLMVYPSALRATEVGAREIPAMVDEVPALAIAAARAEGRTLISGAGELRVKESDRLSALARNLHRLGVGVGEREDGLEIEGSKRGLSGQAETHGDHRIAMAFGVLGSCPGCSVSVDVPTIVNVSYPGFWEDLAAVTSPSAPRRADDSPTGPSSRGDAPAATGKPRAGSDRARPVVTLDGPAGSGKSSTAKEAAVRLGLRHLDSGALYRAATLAALQSGYAADSWGHLSFHQARALGIDLEEDGDRFAVSMDGEVIADADLRNPEVTGLVSSLSSVPAVRASLLDVQRRAGARYGLVADGRDMGTVVFPDADVKFFIVADLTRRARRRLMERGNENPTPAEVRTEADELDLRDRRDSERDTAPLRKPEDAFVIDTSDLSFEQQVQVVVDRVRSLTG